MVAFWFLIPVCKKIKMMHFNILRLLLGLLLGLLINKKKTKLYIG